MLNGAGVCGGSGTTCLAQFTLACDVDVTTGTLDDLTESATLLSELRDVIVSALSEPARVIEHIEATLPGATTTRRVLQTSNLNILIRLYLDEFAQPVDTSNAAAAVCPTPPIPPHTRAAHAAADKARTCRHACRFRAGWSRPRSPRWT